MPLNEKARFNRRKLMAGSTGAMSALLLGGCDRLSEDPTVQRVLASAESVTRRMQRLLGGDHSLAPEYAEADLSKEFKANGTLDPDDDDYQALASKQFVDWRLEVTGLVNHPAQYSLDESARHALAHADHPPRLRGRMELHRQVERCATWRCAAQAEPQSAARYVVFHCADPMDNGDPNSKY